MCQEKAQKFTQVYSNEFVCAFKICDHIDDSLTTGSDEKLNTMMNKIERQKFPMTRKTQE